MRDDGGGNDKQPPLRWLRQPQIRQNAWKEIPERLPLPNRAAPFH